MTTPTNECGSPANATPTRWPATQTLGEPDDGDERHDEEDQAARPAELPTAVLVVVVAVLDDLALGVDGEEEVPVSLGLGAAKCVSAERRDGGEGQLRGRELQLTGCDVVKDGGTGTRASRGWRPSRVRRPCPPC